MCEEDETARRGRDAEVADEAERRHGYLTPGDRQCDRIGFGRPSLPQQPDRFLVSQLMKVVVEGADAVEDLGWVDACDDIGLFGDLLQSLVRRHGHRNADLCSPLTLHGDQGSLHRGSSRQAVIDDYRGVPGRADLRATAEVSGPATLQLRQLEGARLLEKEIVRAGATTHLLIDHRLGLLAVYDGTECHFRRARRADFAH